MDDSSYAYAYEFLQLFSVNTDTSSALRALGEHGEKRARRTEVGVVSNTGRGARLGGVVRARAAVRVVRGVAEAGDTCGLAARDLAGLVLGAAERCWALGVQVDGAVRDVAALVVVHAHGDVEAIHERD